MPRSPRLAVITGASAGIGAEFARQLAAEGYDLLLVARRQERLAEVAAEIRARYPVAIETLVVDLTDADATQALADRLRRESALALLVNNAGFGTVGRFWQTKIESQIKMHELHVMATVRLTHAALGNMTIQRRGSIISVASVAAFARTESNIGYSATKSWMTVFMEGLHLELRAINSPVRVQSLCPGFTYSEFHDVAGVDRSLAPKQFWLTAESVVRASLRGLERGDVLVVPDWRYRWFVRIFPRLPLRWRLALQATSPHRRISRGLIKVREGR